MANKPTVIDIRKSEVVLSDFSVRPFSLHSLVTNGTEIYFEIDGVEYYPSAEVRSKLDNGSRQLGPLFTVTLANHPANHIVDFSSMERARRQVRLMRPVAGNACAGCGLDNPNSLMLTFLYSEAVNTAESWFVPDVRVQGALGTMHGGYVSLILDESMGKVLSTFKLHAPTAQLNVRFRKPVLIGKLIRSVARLVNVDGRKYYLEGALYDQDELLADATGLFINVKKPTLVGEI